MIVILNKRKREIILKLINENKKWAIEEIAKEFLVSERTIRYDIDEINTFFINEGISITIELKDGMIQLYNELYNKSEILSLLNSINIDFVKYGLSNEQRKYIILNELFLSKGFVTINDLANEIFVSRNTIINDLNNVRDWLIHNNMDLISIPSKGLKIEGKEIYFRKCVLKLYQEALSLEQYIRLAQKEIILLETNTYPKILYSKLFNNIEIEKVYNVIENIQQKYGVIFSDLVFSDLVVYLTMSIHRIRQNKTLNIAIENIMTVRNSKAFEAVFSVRSLMIKCFDIDFNIDEIAYITQYLLASDISQRLTQEEYHNRLEIQILIIDLITRVGKCLNWDLADEQLIENLCAYMSPLICGNQQQTVTHNPYIVEIKLNYQEIFQAIKSNITPIEEYIGVNIQDDVIGYMTLCFATLLEKYSNVNVLVLCSAGFFTTNLLSTRLKNMFNVNIVASGAIHSARKLLKQHQVDIIVTTSPLIVENIPCILVNPLLTDEDVRNLYQTITEYRNRKTVLSFNDIKSKKRTAEKITDANMANSVTAALQSSYKTYMLGLSDVLTKDRIKLDIVAKDWKEAIVCTGNLLLQNGDINEGYIESMINNFEENGPYFVMWPGIALPHSDSYELCKRLSIGFVRLRCGVEFGHKNNDPVDLVFVLATPDKINHVKAMMQLSDLLSHNVAINRLRKAKDPDEVIEIISLMCIED